MPKPSAFSLIYRADDTAILLDSIQNFRVADFCCPADLLRLSPYPHFTFQCFMQLVKCYYGGCFAPSSPTVLCSWALLWDWWQPDPQRNRRGQQYSAARLPQNLLPAAKKCGIACFFATFVSNSRFFRLLFNFTIYKRMKSRRCKLWFCALAPSS